MIDEKKTTQIKDIAVNSNDKFIDEIKIKVNQIVIETEEHFLKANELLGSIKKQARKIDNERKALIAPFNDFKNKINADFKKNDPKINEIKELLSSKIFKYTNKIEKQRREEAEKARQEELKKLEEERQEEIKLEKMRAEFAGSQKEELQEKIENIDENVETAKDLARNAPLEIKETFTAVDNTTIRKDWNYEIIDPDLVPALFCSPDHKKIKAAISNGLMKEIPGLRIFQKSTIVNK